MAERSRYKFYKVRKKSGGYRELAEPDANLKRQQKNLVGWLRGFGLHESRVAHGFIPYKNIVSNARLHVGKKYVFKMDFSNFFPSIKDYMLESCLARYGVPEEHIQEIIYLACLDGSLPQGSPASPYLSNIYLKFFDYRILCLASKMHCTYTRYADDLAFSSDEEAIKGIKKPVKVIVEDVGLKLNEKKCHLLTTNKSQKITGVVVNEKINFPRYLRDMIRAWGHRIYTKLVKEGLDTFDRHNFQEYKGYVSFVSAVNPKKAKAFLAKQHEVESLLQAYRNINKARNKTANANT